jgi:CheY-like chemotaxis protein
MGSLSVAQLGSIILANSSKILVVDEDPAVRKNIEQALTAEGYSVVTALSGEDALWELDQGKYDAVFTDLVMRGMSGLDVAEEIHLRQPGLPVVIVTTQVLVDDQKRVAAAAGVVEFLHKPLAPEQLVDTANRVLQATLSLAALQSQTPAAGVAPAAAVAKPASRLKDIVLFFLAPFVGLFYVLIFPAVGLVMLASMLLNAETQEPEEAKPLHPVAKSETRILKTAAMMVIAGLIGISYAMVAPMLGIGVLLWFSFQAWGKLGASALKA